jgi:CHAT domain-containing protein/glutaredoxin 2
MASKWSIFFHPVFAFLSRSKRHFKKYLSGLSVTCWRSRAGYILLSCITAIAVLMASPSFAKMPIAPVTGVSIAQNSPEPTTEAQRLDQNAREQYANGQFREAATAFQQAAQRYQTQRNILGQAISLSNLSLANQHLGLWTEATKAISDSLRLLQSELQQNNSPDCQSAYAQALNIRAKLELSQGQAEQAIAIWGQVVKIQQQLGNAEQARESQVNQARALQALGLYKRAITVLEAALKTPEQTTLLLANLPEGTLPESAANPASELNQRLQALPHTPATVVALQSLGESLQVVGNLDQARTIVQHSLQLAEELSLTDAIASAHLNLGNVTRAEAIAQLQLNNLSVKQAVAQLRKQPSLSLIQQQLQYRRTQAAQEFIDKTTDETLYHYQQAAIEASPPLIQVQARLNRLSLLLDRQEWAEAEAAIGQIFPLLNSLPPSRGAIDAHINLAQSLVRLADRAAENSPSSHTSRQQLQAAQLLATAHQQASKLNNTQADSYALGSLGELYEYSKQWTEAETLTRQALEKVNAVSVTNLPYAVNDGDLAYRWQYQLGRILQAQNDRAGAIQAYEEAAKTLQEHLRKDVASSNLSYQFSFNQDAQQPVHKAWMELLLQPEQPSQAELQRVREIGTSLLEAQLTSFLQEPCEVVTPQQVDNIVKKVKTAQKTAVFYPVILPDRLEVIVKLPTEEALFHYRHQISQEDLLEQIGNLQIALEEDYTFEAVESLAGQFYNWIVKPAEEKLEANGVDTLVFTLDRQLQSIPMATLYDGKQKKYLIEKYAVSAILGLKFGSSDRMLPPEELKVIWAGLSTVPEKVEIGGEDIRNQFLPLKYVGEELEVVKNSGIQAVTLQDKKFTLENFNAQLNEEKFPVVHLATHGQFSFDPKRTFLLTDDTSPINVDELAALLRLRGQIRLDSIDLLILNACETAAGDNLATLGIAGAAVRAGARSAIASLWTLDDAPSVDFTRILYEKLRQPNVSKAEALQQAQLELMRNPQYRHPRYWSPYILAGNWLPLTTSSSIGSTGSSTSN